jgi:endoglucanase Acf2
MTGYLPGDATMTFAFTFGRQRKNTKNCAPWKRSFRRLLIEELELRLTPAAQKLAFVQQVGDLDYGKLLSPIQIQLQDGQGGNDKTAGVGVTLSFGSNLEGALLGGTVTVKTDTSGIATFNDLIITGGNVDGKKAFTFLATASGLQSSVSPAAPDMFSVKPGSYTLAFDSAGQPKSSTQAGQSLGTIKVRVLQQGGNPSADSSTQVTLSLDHNASGARFVDASGNPLTSNPTATTDVNGIATFTNVALDKAGNGYSLRATSLNKLFLVTASSSAFAITAAAAKKLTFTQQPATTAAGTPINGVLLPQGVLVQVLDQFANPVIDSSAPVTIALNGSSFAAGSTTTVNATVGVAAFTNLVVAASKSGLTLTATSQGLTAATSSAFAVTTADQVASKLAFTVAPTGVISTGQLIGTVTVSVQNANSQTITTDNTTQVQISRNFTPEPGSSSPGSLLGILTQTVTNGVATFNNLVINRNVDPAYTVAGATNTSPINLTLNNHNLVSGMQIVVSGVEGNTGANGRFTVAVVDANTVSLTGSTGNGQYTGGGTWALAVTDASNATPIVITSPKHGLSTGSQVTITGVQGNTAANGTFLVTKIDADHFSLSGSKGNGAFTANTGSFVVAANPYSLTAVAVNTPTLRPVSGATNVDKSPIKLTIVNHHLTTGARITVTGVSGNTAANGTFTVTVVDSNTVTLDNSAGNGAYTGGGTWAQAVGDATNASPIVITSPQHGLVNGSQVTLSGIQGNTAANGSFLVTKIDDNHFSLNGSAGNGAYSANTGTFVVPTLASATSPVFNVSSGVATHLLVTGGNAQIPANKAKAFTAGDVLNDVQVTLLDDLGNIVRSDSKTVVVLSISKNAAHQDATFLLDNNQKQLYISRTAVNGVVTFSGMKVITAGTGFQLTASTGDIVTTPADTDPATPFDVLPGKLNGLVFEKQPGTTASGQVINGDVRATLVDEFGNAIQDDSSTQVQLSLQSSSIPGVTLIGTTTQKAIQGYAVFNAVGIALPAGGTAESTAILKASASVGATSFSATSHSFQVALPPSGQVAPAQIALSSFTLGDGSSVTQVSVGQKFGFTATLKNQGGNVDPKFANILVSSSLTANPNNQLPIRGIVTLQGQIAQKADGSSVATFSDLTITKGGVYTVQVVSGVGAVTAQAQITVNPATPDINFTALPSPVPYGQPFTLKAILLPKSGTSGIPTGKVTFTLEDKSVLGTATLDPRGIAQIQVGGNASPNAGDHKVTATYSGDDSFVSVMADADLKINPSPTNVIVLIQNPKTTYFFGEPIQVTAYVNAQSPSSASVNNGQVTFKALPEDQNPVFAPVNVDKTGIATITLQGLGPAGPVNAPGAPLIQASYATTTNFLAGVGSVSPSPQIVRATPNITLSINPQSATRGTGVDITFSVVVTPQFAGAPLPEGTIVFVRAGQDLGAPAKIGADGTASVKMNVNDLPPGLADWTARYVGDDPKGHYNPAVSVNSVSLNIIQPPGALPAAGGNSGSNTGLPPQNTNPPGVTTPTVHLPMGPSRDVLPNGANPADIHSVGLGSYTDNFNTIQQFPSYNTDANGNSVVPLFFQPSYTFNPGQIPTPSHPNEAAGFTQVPQSTDWWTSLMFRRNLAQGNPVPTSDPSGNQLYPLQAQPLTGMPTQSGLGLSYLNQFDADGNPTTVSTFGAPAFDDPVKTKPDTRFPSILVYESDYGGATAGANSVTSDRLYEDFQIGLVGLSKANPLPLAYSDWTVTMDWSGKLRATMGQGLPFVYFQTPQGGQMQLTTDGAPKTVALTAFEGAGTQATTSGTGPIRLTVDYTLEIAANNPLNLSPAPDNVKVTVHRTYGIFLSATTKWSISSGANPTLTTSTDLGANGYFSVATLPDSTPATFTFYRQHAYNLVTGGYGNYSYDEASGKVTTVYYVQTTPVQNTGFNDLSSNTLMALYPSQYQNMLDPNAKFTQYNYGSPRGTLRLLDGNSFVTQLQFHGVLPFIPDITGAASGSASYHRDLWRNYLYPYLVSVSTEVTNDGSLSLDRLLIGNNVYNNGQSLMGAMQLVPLLQQVSQSAELAPDEQVLAAQLAEQVFRKVEEVMGAWLSAADDQALQLLYYEPDVLKDPVSAGKPGWNALLGEAAGFFSSESLNDQNLGFGYYVKTAALISLYDPTWGDMSKFGGIMNLIADEAANPSRSSIINPNTLTRFPFLRNFNVYTGQSFADGAANNPQGTNQESVSESLNFASGLLLFGQITGNTALLNLGTYLYTTESTSFYLNYFNVNPASGAFPTGSLRGLRSAEDPGTATTITYDLRQPNIPKPASGATATGYVFLGTLPIQTFTVDQNGVLTFKDVNTAVNDHAIKATAGTLDFTTGKVSLTWNKAPGANFVAVQPTALPLPVMPIISNGGGANQTFFGTETSKMTSIQVLPLTGGSFYLGGLNPNVANDVSFIDQAVAYGFYQTTEEGSIPITPPQFVTPLYVFQAFSNPDLAIQNYLQQLSLDRLKIYDPSGTDVHAYNIDFMRVLQEYGHVDPSVTADVATYVVFIKGNARTFVAFNPGPTARTVTFKDSTGATIFTMVVPPRTVYSSAGKGLATQAQDYSLATPTNRFFLAAGNAASGQLPKDGTLVSGTPGTGEYAVKVAAAGVNIPLSAPPQDSNKLSVFSITGLSGVLDPTRNTQFHIWVDPGFVNNSQGAPLIGMQIEYDPDGTGVNKVTQVYSLLGVGTTPGYIDFNSSQVQLFGTTIPSLPTLFANGKITVTFWAAQGQTAINIRTDAAREQGRVSYLDLPYTFTKVGAPALPSVVKPKPLSTTPIAPMTTNLPAAPSSGQGHTYVATISGLTATFVGNADSDTIIFDAAEGDDGLRYLRHNRFTAGDPGFVSDLDFDSTVPGEQRLLASNFNTVVVDTGTGTDIVRIGTASAPASELFAKFTINNGDDGNDQLIVDDSASVNESNVRVSISATIIRDEDVVPVMFVTHTGGVFGGGIRFISSQNDDQIDVLATRVGESLLLDSAGGVDKVTIGNSGSVQQILGQVTVHNTPRFTNLLVDNSAAINFSSSVMIDQGAIKGLAPADILFDPADIDDIQISGGTSQTTYNIEGSIAASDLTAQLGIGAKVNISNNSVVNNNLFPGKVTVFGAADVTSLLIDNSAGTGATVNLNRLEVDGLNDNGLFFYGQNYLATVVLAGDNHVTIGGTPFAQTSLITSKGTNDVAVKSIQSPLTIAGSGNDHVTIDYGPSKIVAPVTFGEEGTEADTLTLTSETLAALTYNFTGAGSGTILGDNAGMITYEGLVSDSTIVDELFASNRIFNFTSAKDVLSLSDGPGAGTSSLTSEETSTHVVFNDPTVSLQINSQGGGDTATLAPRTNTRVFFDGGTTSGSADASLSLNLQGVTNSTLTQFSSTSGEWNFGNRRGLDYANVAALAPVPVTLSGQVFDDLNGNGVKDPNEPGLPGFVIQLDVGADGTPVATVVTDQNGNYQFVNVLPGGHVVTELQQTQRRLTSPSGGSYQVTVVSGQNIPALNFGNLDSASKSYVYQIYLDLLGRNVDPAGLEFWNGLLNQGISRPQTVASIQGSLEYLSGEVRQTYQDYLQRPADDGGLSFWVTFLGHGNLRQMQEQFLASTEYFVHRGNGTNDGFLVALYADVLGRTPGGSEAFAAALQAGEPRIFVATAVLTSPESNTRLVEQLYGQYLRRHSDPNGLQAWVAFLSAGGDVEQVIQGLVGSQEYYARF